MKKIKLILAGLLLVPALALTADVATSSYVSAQVDAGLNATGQSGSGASVNEDLVKQAVNFLLYAVGIIAVVMLIWGGIRYATSAGDSNKVSSAKNTIIYAIVGLLVAIFAYAIVNFVITKTSSP